MALDYFRRTAAIDLSDAAAAIGGGVHIGALGGLWMTAIFGFAGVAFADEGISLSPRLPASWTRMAFRLQWRGRLVYCEIRQPTRHLTLVLERGPAMTVHIGAADLALDPGVPIEASF
jgi:trehalose/maltose hydrolase-like predicted phosphorylase